MNKALFAIAIVALASIGTVMAFNGDPSLKGPYFDEERHDAMQTAFEENDYGAWHALMTEDGGSPKITEMVTEENFDRFADMHQAMIGGDREAAQEIREELGFGQGMKRGWEQGRRMKGFNGHMMHNCQCQNQ